MIRLRHRRGLAIVALLAGFALATFARPADAQTTLRLAHVNAASSPTGQGAERLAELASEYSGGELEIRVFHASQLGNNREIFSQIRSGAIQLAVTPYPLLRDIVPDVIVYTAGYMYRDWDHLKAVLQHEDFGQTWNRELVEKGGVRPLANYYYGSRQLTTTDTPVRAPADLEGMKIRAVPNEMSLAVISGLGATPTPVPFPELFQALRQGVVDGQENPLPTIWSQKFFEVQDYLMVTAHQMIPLPWLANEGAWQGLSESQQEALARAAAEAAAYTTELTVKEEAEIIARLEERGMTVIGEDDGLELDSFRDAVRSSVLDAFEGKVWREGLAAEIAELDAAM